MKFRSREVLGFVAMALACSAFAQPPPIEDQHDFGPRQFRAGPNEEIPFLDELFKVTRSGTSKVGDNVTFSCQIQQGFEILTDICAFSAPNGHEFYYKTNVPAEVYADEDFMALVPGISGIDAGEDNNICGLEIANITGDLFGPWICAFNQGVDVEDNGVQAHSGHFTILTDDEYFVKDVRLPKHVVPEHYELQLQPIIEEGNFTTYGSVKLHFHVDEAQMTSVYDSFEIIMHAKDIAIDESSVVVKRANGDEIKIRGFEYGFERDFFFVELLQPMPFNEELTIEMNFKSYLNNYLVGFYRSSYTDDDGQPKFLAVTQFESHYARQAFPCLDEPEMKANFSVSLITNKNLTAISNMDVLEVTDLDDEYKTTKFATSVKMSTYLVAFLVSDFDFTENQGDSNYKIWHQASKKGQADLAAENGAKILEFYEEFFDIDYPLPKTDMAAIPDFSAGAMENWGLITYRETLLLYHEGVSDVLNKDEIIKVMAHELAHQWFGNLVTMKWWTDLWLNEGFATYTQYHGVEHVFEESRPRDRIVINDLQNAMGIDSLENSAALSKEVTNPNYDAEFGTIAYSKGCSILRMAENFLTLETFKKGVSNYLKENQFSNAERDDLWQALTNAAVQDGRLPVGVTVKDIMDSWTSDPGYPVVTVRSTGNTLELRQKRFYLNPTVQSPANTTWVVPINVVYPSSDLSDFEQTTPDTWMMKTNPVTKVPITKRPYIINAKQTGYYRVNYEPENWNSLAEVLKEDHTKIHELNRAQIIDDSMHLARSNQLDYKIALSLTEYLDKEKEYIPWQSALRSFSFIDLMLNDNSSLNEFAYLKKFLVRQLTPLYDELKFEVSDKDDHLTILNRRSVLTWLCKYEHPECVTTAKSKFAEWMKNPTVNKINPNLRDVVYTTAIRLGGEAEWDFLWNRFLVEKIDSERLKLIYALGVSTNANKINRYLSETLSMENVRLQDVTYINRAIGSYAPGRRFQFEWLLANWVDIKEKFGDRFDGYVFNLISGYAGAANTEAEITRLEDFLEDKNTELGSVVSDIRRSIETAKINKKWTEDNQGVVADWFRDRTADPDDGNGAAVNKSYFGLFLGLWFAVFALFGRTHF